MIGLLSGSVKAAMPIKILMSYLMAAMLFSSLSAKPLTAVNLAGSLSRTDAQTSVSFHHLAPAKRYRFKRNTSEKRALSATYHFRCPFLPPTTRVFEWEAEHKMPADTVTMRSLKNIDYFGPLLSDENEFSAFWYHSFCELHEDRMCKYLIHGYTEGEVDEDDGLILELVRNSNIATVLPKVEETCTFAGQHAGPHQCPAPDIHATEVCTIISIVVRVLY